ncbi:Ribosome-recycling factor [Gracilariopsis chorda]|uniref:Ribosome-recycling factor n=1 Tax=Gracilariopsis chorda TaxID=448386 RepID=A0A2V3IGD2_9FLOR|nr:Ribosome-recycling factor [Gracilariopsis chorda]|eukprot:PXF41112.1 Ribosome-recycling factor [Gracilariopsis chorda]
MPPASRLQYTYIPVRFKKSKAKAKSSSSLESFGSFPINLSKYEDSMKKALDVLQTNYSKLRVDGATPAILDDVSVSAYGTETSLKNVAQVAVRDGRTLVIHVFDESTVGAVEKAIRKAGLNLNPVREADGKLKVPVPRSSKTTRDTMKETAAKEAESAKIATRLVRRKAMEEVKTLKDEVSKDDIKRIEKGVQALTDRYIKDITQVQQNKVHAIESLDVK